MPQEPTRRAGFLLYLKRVARLENMQNRDWLLVFILLIGIHVPVILKFYRIDLENNGYLQLADAMLHGRFYLPPAAHYPDLIQYHDKWYVPYPPFPALLLMPFVAVLGKFGVNTVVVCLLLTCLNLVLSRRILVKLRVDPSLHTWLIAALIFGTGYWFCLFSSMYVYFIAHIVSFTLQLLFLNELLGKRRSLLLGLLIGGSLLTRQLTVVYMVMGLLYIIYESRQRKNPFPYRQLLQLCAGAGAGVAMYLLYNYVRFGNLFDVGYGYIAYNEILADRVNQYGVFSTKYFWFNFYSFFLKGFNLQFEGAGLLTLKGVDVWGTSLFSASPFVIAAFRARAALPVKVITWATILIILGAQLFYHNNGYTQINSMRFSMDFLPLLFVLIALGASAIPRWLFRSLAGYAIVLNIIAIALYYIYR